jgi:hypothetical protein
MSEELLGGNHTTQEQVPNQEINQQQTNTEQPPATTQENYFRVKYNHEEREIPYEEAPTYIQKGLNYDKVQQRADEYEQDLSRLQQFYGFQSREDLLQALDEAERERERQEYLDRGLDPDALDEVLNKRIEQHPDIQYAREMKKQAEEQQRFQSEVSELLTEFPDLKPEQIPPEVWQLQQQKGLSLLDSYLRVSYKSLGQQKEQEAITKLQQNALSTPGSLGAGAEHKTGYSNLSSAEKKALRDRVLRGENIQI